MERGRRRCLEWMHARQVWLLGVFGYHIFLLGLPIFSGSGLPFCSECWGQMEVRVPVLPRPPVGTEKPPGEVCFAGVLGWREQCWTSIVQLFWHQVSPGFQPPHVSLFFIPQRMSLRYTGEASGMCRGTCKDQRMGRRREEIQFNFTMFNMDLSDSGYLRAIGGLLTLTVGALPGLSRGPPCDYCERGKVREKNISSNLRNI